jgi:acyl-CoA dehydrogenase
MKLQADQLEIQKIARDFALREIAPYAQACDRSATLPEQLISRAFAQGLVHVRVPKVFGGLALTTLDTCVITEELAACCSGIAGAIEASELALTPLIVRSGSNECRETLSLVGKEASLLGLSAQIESDLDEGRIYAKHRSEGYSLQGSCPSVLNASIASRLFFITRLESEPTGSASPAVPQEFVGFYIDTSAQGIAIKPRPSSLGRRAANLATVIFKDAFIKREYSFKLGDSPSEFLHSVALTNDAIIASGCVGLARSALEHSIKYAVERRTFDQQIAQHQAIGFMLADMKKDVEAARAMVRRAAQLSYAGRISLQLYIGRMCRVYAQEMAMNVSMDAVQIFGGYGYSKEYPVEKLMRDAKTYDIFSGTSQMMKGEVGHDFLKTEVG